MKGNDIDELSERIINLILYEMTNFEIAEETGYSIGLIKWKLKQLYNIYGVKSKVGLVREFLNKK